MRAKAISDAPREQSSGGVDDGHPSHEEPGGCLFVPAEEREVPHVDEESERREYHSARGEAEGEVESAPTATESPIPHSSKRLRPKGRAPPYCETRGKQNPARFATRPREPGAPRLLAIANVAASPATSWKEHPPENQADRDPKDDRRAHRPRGSSAVGGPSGLKRDGLRRHEHARRAGPVQEAAGEKEDACAVGQDPQHIEHHHHDLECQAREQDSAPTQAIDERTDERTEDDAHRAVRRQDQTDERERQPQSQADDRQDGERNAARHAREERPRSERQSERPWARRRGGWLPFRVFQHETISVLDLGLWDR